jgi:arylsulfatase A-like enzyme
MRALPILAAALLAQGCAKESEPPNVLIVVVDTLRADHLSSYGYPQATTPHIDALAAKGLRFTHAQSPRAKTTPAVASLMTGLYPHDHGVRDLTTPLDRKVPTLAECFKRSGYSTGAIVGNYVMQKSLSGLDRGFEMWVEDFPTTQGVPPDDVPQRTANSLTDGALAALGLAEPVGSETSIVDPARPWLLYLHYMDPHGYYDPPQEHRIFDKETTQPIPASPPPALPFGREEIIATYNVPPDAWLPDGRVDANSVIARYNGEVHFADAEIGRLLAQMDTAGMLEDTWIIFVSDHGESLGEHGYWFEHGRYPYEATCRVPLIVHPPRNLAGRPEPGVRTVDVSLADLTPTLLELCDVKPTPGMRNRGKLRGESRARVILRDTPARRPVFCEKVERSEKSRTVQTKAIRQGDWKLLRRYAEDMVQGEPEMVLISSELYDLASDPREERNLHASPPESAPLTELEDALLVFTAADEDFEDLARILQSRRDELSRSDPEALRRLQALGY